MRRAWAARRLQLSAALEPPRPGLLQVMQNYLDAVLAHDRSRVEISVSLKRTDNGVSAKPGDGTWKTAPGLVRGARLDFADPVTHNVSTPQ